MTAAVRTLVACCAHWPVVALLPGPDGSPVLLEPVVEDATTALRSAGEGSADLANSGATDAAVVA